MFSGNGGAANVNADDRNRRQPEFFASVNDEDLLDVTRPRRIGFSPTIATYAKSLPHIRTVANGRGNITETVIDGEHVGQHHPDDPGRPNLMIAGETESGA